MSNIAVIKKKISPYNKKIFVDGCKSISIRSILLASIGIGKSTIFSLPESEDVKSTIDCIKRLGIKIIKNRKNCVIFGKGINGFDYKKNITINAGNSGTCGRLILGLLVASKNKIKLIGDKSLSKRNFGRIVDPLEKFGSNFIVNKNRGLPLKIIGSDFIRPIKFREEIGSSQVKSSCMFAALNAPGKTIIISKKSRNHSELFFKFLNIPIKIKKNKNYDLIEVEGQKNFHSFKYKIPGDVSSAAFFIALTLISKNSQLTIKNVNVNPTRIGYINILNKMGAKIKILNKKNYKGEIIGDIFVKSNKNLKSINCPSNLNSITIDEFNLLFINAAFSKGVSTFKNLEELNKKESKRLEWGFKILKMIGIKTKKIGNHGIKIWGNPNLELNKKYIIKNYLKDHRIAMCTFILALARGGNWRIEDVVESIKTSFPSFLKIVKTLGGKYEIR